MKKTLQMKKVVNVSSDNPQDLASTFLQVVKLS